jgi:hypothetical protein
MIRTIRGTNLLAEFGTGRVDMPLAAFLRRYDVSAWDLMCRHVSIDASTSRPYSSRIALVKLCESYSKPPATPHAVATRNARNAFNKTASAAMFWRAVMYIWKTGNFNDD